MRTLPIFRKLPAVVGMVHLPPLPGSPRWGGDMSKVVDFAARSWTASNWPSGLEAAKETSI